MSTRDVVTRRPGVALTAAEAEVLTVLRQA
jgi:hypothetical protein